MYWLLSALLVAQLVLIVCLAVTVQRKIRSVEDQVYDFFVSEEGKPSKFANLTDTIAAVFANRVMQSLTAAFRGSAGGTAKGEAEEARREFLAANPLVGMLGGAKLGKNPMAMGLLSMLGQNLMGHASDTPNGGHPKSDFRHELAKYR